MAAHVFPKGHTLSSRQSLRIVLVTGALLVIMLAFVPRSVLATTGPPNATLPPARYHVDPKLAALFPGEYVLTSVARTARIRSAAIAVRINSSGILEGAGQFYSYDAQGFQTSWIALLYNFHTAAHGVMVIDVLTPAGDRLLGQLFVQRSSKGDLFGRIVLGRHSYSIKWHKTMSL